MRSFTRIPNDITSQPWFTSPTTTYLYTWLSLNADDNGQITTSRADLSERTGLTERQIRTALEKLEATKYVTKLSTKLPTKFATTLTVSYLGNYKPQKTKSDQVNDQAADQVNDQPRAYKNDNIIISCLKEDREDKEKESSLRSDSKKSDDQYSFDVFWDLYDKKVDKKKTLTAWGRLTAEKRRKIIEYVPGYVSSTPNRRFRKNPLTFLNNESWENEIIQDRNDTRLLDNNLVGKYKDTSW